MIAKTVKDIHEAELKREKELAEWQIQKDVEEVIEQDKKREICENTTIQDVYGTSKELFM